MGALESRPLSRLATLAPHMCTHPWCGDRCTTHGQTHAVAPAPSPPAAHRLPRRQQQFARQPVPSRLQVARGRRGRCTDPPCIRCTACCPRCLWTALRTQVGTRKEGSAAAHCRLPRRHSASATPPLRQTALPLLIQNIIAPRFHSMRDNSRFSCTRAVWKTASQSSMSTGGSTATAASRDLGADCMSRGWIACRVADATTRCSLLLMMTCGH